MSLIIKKEQSTINKIQKPERCVGIKILILIYCLSFTFFCLYVLLFNTFICRTNGVGIVLGHVPVVDLRGTHQKEVVFQEGWGVQLV